jgi:LysM repeat protein
MIDMKAGFLIAALAVVALAAPAYAQNTQAGQIVFRTPQEAVRYYEDLVGQLTVQVRAMQDDNAKMVNAFNEMQRQIQVLSQSNQNLSQELASLKRQVADESAANKDRYNKATDKIMGAISSANQQAAAERAAAEKAAAAAPSEMIEYTVQSGATLSMIASAYKVSLDDLRKANNLKSDVLRVGQKILIPKK